MANGDNTQPWQDLLGAISSIPAGISRTIQDLPQTWDILTKVNPRDWGRPIRELVASGQIREGYQPSRTTVSTGGAQVMPGGMTQEEAYRLLNPMRTGGGGAGAQIRAEQEAARRYWNNVSRYGQTRGQAFGQAYGQLSGRTARTGADIGQRGLETAASIEQIYQNLANQAQALAGGRGGMVTPETAASGLVPMSAEAALAAQQIPAEGASLANYLQQNVGIQASMLDALARAQGEQGVATIADYLGQIATGRIADERRMADRAAQLRAAAAAAASNRQDVFNQGLAEARRLDLNRGNEVRTLTAYYNSESGKNFKKQIDKFAKDNNYTVASVLADPSTAKLVGGITSITGA